MKIDLKAQSENFARMDFEEKRRTVADLLLGVKQGNELFENIYELIMSEVAVEQDFRDVFESLVIVLYQEDVVAEKAALSRLGDIRARLEQALAREREEKVQEQKEAAALIQTIG